MNKKILLILLNLLIIACISLLCFAPLLVTTIAGSVAQAAGCQLDEGSIHPCIINGVDYGETLYSLGMTAWFMFFSAPVAAGLLVFYLLALGVITLVRTLRKQKAITGGQGAFQP